jgi:ATP-dependent Lon protease
LKWGRALTNTPRSSGPVFGVHFSGLNLGGSIDLLHNAIDVVELAVEKGASVVLMPVSARKQLFELSDDMATRVNVLFYSDARAALLKAIAD